jgi:cell wall-associated NlpC family hydrolase
MSPAWANPVPTSGAGSSADTIAGVTAQIAATKSQLASLDASMSAAAETYDADQLRLAQAQAAAADAAARVARANQDVQLATAARRSLASSAYRSGGMDTLSAILSGDPGEALDRVGDLGALSRRADAAETRVRLAQGDLTQAQADAKAQVADAQSAVDAVNAQRQALEASAGQEQTLLDGLVAKQSELQRQEQEREAAAARARQQAAEAAAAKAAALAGADAAQTRQQASLARQATAAFTGAADPAPAAAGPAIPLGSGGAPVAVAEAHKLLGRPYVWGAAGPDTFDCSGLTQWVWAKAGVALQHYTGDQWNEGRHVSRDQLQPGDLVFFDPGLDHVGIYVGNGKMIHAPHTGAVVRLEDVWWDSFQGGVRPGG